MDLTHLHLLINHLGIMGSILGGLVLAYGIWAKSNQTKIAGYLVLIISTVGAIIAYLTGEPAEETVENIQGISHSVVEQHEDFAVIALIAMIIAGLIALIGILLTVKRSALAGTVAWVALTVSLISFGLIARTGYLGGLIRHTEVSSGVSSTAPMTEMED